MAYIQIKSNNPDMSYCISKNPNSSMLAKTLRQGYLFGWFSDKQTYNIYFQDSPDEISFKNDIEQEYEYLNSSKYSSLFFVCNAIAEMFGSVLKNDVEKDFDIFEHTITIGCAYLGREEYIKKSFEKELKKYSIKIEYKQLYNKYYTITFTGKSTLRYMLSYVSIFCFISAIINKNENIFVENSLLSKYLNIISYIDAPYFVRYLFKIFCIKDSSKFFKEIKEKLETSESHKYSFNLQTLHKQRIDFIKNILSDDGEIPILDIGCGEGLYVTQLANKINKTYYAYDINEECLEIVRGKCEKREMANVKTYNNMSDVIADIQSNNEEKLNILLTEVIEHADSKDSAKKIVEFILQNFNINKLIITTPNKDFNTFFYDDDSSMRHIDHKFEMTYDEFNSFINDIIPKDIYEFEIGQIGDSVDSIQPTSYVKIWQK